jgi:hypothetical protein
MLDIGPERGNLGSKEQGQHRRRGERVHLLQLALKAVSCNFQSLLFILLPLSCSSLFTFAHQSPH